MTNAEKGKDKKELENEKGTTTETAERIQDAHRGDEDEQYNHDRHSTTGIIIEDSTSTPSFGSGLLPFWKRFKSNLCQNRILSRIPAVFNIHQQQQQRNFTESRASQQPQSMKTGQRWLLVLFVITTFLIVIILLSSVNLKKGSLDITLDLDELTERGKCPACFGVNLCPPMISGKIELNDWTKYSVSKLVNTKNIFYATWNHRGTERKIILKKLAHDHELEQLDNNICERHGIPQGQCDVKDSVRVLLDRYSHTTQNKPDVPILNGEKIGKVTDILLCPSHAKMDYIIAAVQKVSRGPHKNTILANILTMLLLNPEPLILQTFQAENGWPFPIYYGACGRIVAEEYVGRRLTTFYHESFNVRSTIALNLLKIAITLSDRDPNYVLYLTDISPDNFAVNEDNYDVKVIDLENVIIVERAQMALTEHKVFESESSTCETGNSQKECFSFSTDDLCIHPTHDHNYYAICAGILAPDALSREFPLGLLHSVPNEVKDSKDFEKFDEYLEACRVPGPKVNRIEAAKNLVAVLESHLH